MHAMSSILRDRVPEATATAAVAPTVADRVAAFLRSLGMTTVFGVHGANIEDLYSALLRTGGPMPVVAKHEFGAGAMADGCARITNRASGVLTTSGGAAMNVLPALAESYDSRVPVLAVIGTTPRPLIGRGGFQDMLDPPDTVDLPAMLRGVVGGAVTVVDEPARLDAALAAAAATLQASMPAALVIPKDVQAAPAEPLAAPAAPAPPAGAGMQSRAASRSAPGPDHTTLADRLAGAVAAGRRICLWAGEEASRAGAGPALATLAAHLGATVVVSPGGRDAAPPAGCAGVTGVMGHPSAHAALTQADLVVGVGCRMSATDRGGFDPAATGAEVFAVGAAPPRLPGARHIAVTELRDTLRELTARVSAPNRSVRTPRPDRPDHLDVPPTGSAIPMRTAVETIGATLVPGTAVFADAGNVGAAAVHHLPFGAGRFVVALGMGGMGYAIAGGIGNAIAAARAGSPHGHGSSERTVILAGDGAFYMHGMEIHTALEYDAPVTLVVFNNNAHGMCITREQRFFPDVPSVNRFRPADLAAGLAAMFGGLTVLRACDPTQLEAACAELLTGTGPNCLVIDTDPDELPPFAPLLKGTP